SHRASFAPMAPPASTLSLVAPQKLFEGGTKASLQADCPIGHYAGGWRPGAQSGPGSVPGRLALNRHGGIKKPGTRPWRRGRVREPQNGRRSRTRAGRWGAPSKEGWSRLFRCGLWSCRTDDRKVVIVLSSQNVVVRVRRGSGCDVVR